MADPLIGSVIAGQRIECVVGRGGMGLVYRATDDDLGRRVAVKVIAPELAHDPQFRRRFIEESRLAASLDHPNVIPIYRAGEEEGVLFQVMRFVEGEDLRSMLARHGPLAPARAVRIAAQVASALDAAHARGLVHRDVKPANILLGPDDHVYLTDFGLGKRIGIAGDETRSGQLVGTASYIAPEQIRGGDVDARTDVYALGGVLFASLTGSAPFPLDSDEAKLWAHLSEPPPTPSERRPGVPTALDAVVQRAMGKDPAERFQTAGALAAAAQAAVGAPATLETESAASAPGSRRGDVLPFIPRSPVKPYTRADLRRALVANAMADSVGIVAAAVVLGAGLLLGAPALAVPLALLVYACGALRAFFDEDVAEKVLARQRERRRGQLRRDEGSVDTSLLSDDIAGLVVQAREIRRRIRDALDRAELPYPEVEQEVGELVATMERSAQRAQLLRDGLRDAPPEAIARRLDELRGRRDPGQEELVTALGYQLTVQRRMQKQLDRFFAEMERMLVELDTVRGNLVSLSASQEADWQRQIAGGVRGLRDEMAIVADGIAAAYDEGSSVATDGQRVPADA